MGPMERLALLETVTRIDTNSECILGVQHLICMLRHNDGNSLAICRAEVGDTPSIMHMEYLDTNGRALRSLHGGSNCIFNGSEKVA